MNEWKPWEDFKKEPDPLPIGGPPCKDCEYWKPVRKYSQWSNGSINFDGVILCQKREMEHDFSCFRKKE